MEKLTGEAGRSMIRQVPVARGDSLLDRGGVPTRAKELLVVVGLQDQEIAVFEGEPDLGVGPPQVRCDPHSGSGVSIDERDGYRIHRVVHGQEGLDADRTDVERSASLIRLQGLGAAENAGTRLECPIRQVDGRAMTATEDPGPLGVVPMIVRDHDGIDGRGAQPDLSKPSLHLAPAEPGVDQNYRAARLYERSVASAASSENADLHRCTLIMPIRSFTFRTRPFPHPLKKLPITLLEAGLVYAVAALGWTTVVVATLNINHFDLFGMRQVWVNLKGEKYQDLGFRVSGLYRIVRHPIQVGFLIAFWATPTMTVGHLYCALITTAYIFFAVKALEERDLVRELGDKYRNYMSQVSGFVPLSKYREPTA